MKNALLGVLKWSGFCIWLICQSHPIMAQNAQGRIEGVIQTSGKTPLSNANITVKNTRLGAVSSPTGRFVLNNVPVGEQTISVNIIGYQSVQKHVSVSTATTTHITISLTPQSITLPPIVVTGTKSARDAEDTPIQTQVITKQEIDASGILRLGDLLANQTGLAVISDHGSGIQMQGFDPDYTLILIDGEPIIGRTAGTLDLDRFLIGNVEQVEIVKGSTSSLYGSEALAGVINLITRPPQEPFSASLQSRYGSFGSFNITGELETQQNNVGASLFIDRSQSAGYDHTPDTAPPTTPEYTTYTLNPKITYTPNDQTKFTLTGRVYTEDQYSLDEVTENRETVSLNSDAKLIDWSIHPQIVYQWTPSTQITGKLYTASYHTKSELTYQQNGNAYSLATFDQKYHKAELQAQTLIGQTNIVTIGIGGIGESVKADRITGGKQTAQSAFAFFQEEWMPTSWLDVVISGRIDAHSAYKTRLSPKTSLLLKPVSWLRLRGSIGSGFKAPTFQQLYLDFTNPTAGYSVLGSTYVGEGMATFQQEGRIAALLQNPDSLQQIRAESAVSLNGGIEVIPNKHISAKFNVFRNNVKDLIESAPIARKTNGQSVYSYFNLNRVYTQGIETNLTITPFSGATAAIGYQYLEAKDKGVIEEVEAGQVVKIDTETDKLRRVEIAEYGGLYNRSKHTVTVRLMYDNPQIGFTTTLRGLYRGKYGYRDRNLNSILDAPEEFAPGYDLWHLAITQKIRNTITLQVGMDNLFDEKRLDYTPSLPGRSLYAGLIKSF